MPAEEKKPKWKKAPPELIEFLDHSMKDKEADRRLMFGYPVYFVKGNMFSGLFEDKLFIRIPPAIVPSVVQKGYPLEYLEPMAGRPMKNYFVIPAELLSAEEEFIGLLDVSLLQARKLPPKKK
jgi:hypothetical protein